MNRYLKVIGAILCVAMASIVLYACSKGSDKNGGAWPHTTIQNAGIEVAYPPSWIMRATTNGVVFSNVAEPSEASDSSLQNESVFQVAIYRDRNQRGLPVSEWFDQHMRPVVSDRLKSESDITIDGNPGIKVILSGVGGSTAHIYVVRNSDVIEIAYPLFSPKFVDTYSAMVQSLRLPQ